MGSVPPPYNPGQAQSSNKVWLWILVAVVAFCCLASVGIFFAGKSLIQTGTSLASCAINAEMARDATIAYAMEHDGKLPNAATWQDDIKPNYTRLYDKMSREMKLKEMPSFMNFEIAAPGQVLACQVGPDTKTGFAFNATLSGKLLKDIEDKSISLIWETEKPEYNANGDPATRGPVGSKYKIFGQERHYIDVPIEGETDFMDSDNASFDISMNPEDALDPEAQKNKKSEPAPTDQVKSASEEVKK